MNGIKFDLVRIKSKVGHQDHRGSIGPWGPFDNIEGPTERSACLTFSCDITKNPYHIKEYFIKIIPFLTSFAVFARY